MVLDVNGCKMMTLPRNLSGDSLDYGGPPVDTISATPSRSISGAPWGRQQATQELLFPNEKTALSESAVDEYGTPWAHSQYTKHFEQNGFAFAAGAGLDMRFNRALSVRLAGLEYTRSWIHELNGYANPGGGIQLKTGIVPSDGHLVTAARPGPRPSSKSPSEGLRWRFRQRRNSQHGDMPQGKRAIPAQAVGFQRASPPQVHYERQYVLHSAGRRHKR